MEVEFTLFLCIFLCGRIDLMERYNKDRFKIIFFFLHWAMVMMGGCQPPTWHFLPKPPILDLLKHYISLVCSVPVDIIELEMKSLFWFQLILWFGRSASKDKGICGLYAEVIGLIPNWVSGEKGAGWHARHLHLFVSGGGKGRHFLFCFFCLMSIVKFLWLYNINHETSKRCRSRHSLHALC